MPGAGRTAFIALALLMLPVVASGEGVLAWRFEVVDTDRVYSSEVEIATDSEGVVHIVYARVGDLVYAQQQLGLWMEGLVVPSEGAGSIAIGPDDRPHIAYGRPTDARYATLQGGEWVHELVYDAHPWGAGRFTDIAVDASSRVHMIFQAQRPYSPTGLAYATRDAAGWNVEWLAEGAGHVTHAIAVDSNGQPHVVFPADGPNRLVYMTRTQTGWQTETIANEWGAGADIAIDSNDRPHVVYNNEFGGDIFLLVKDSGSWSRGLIFDGTQGLKDSAIALDSNDLPHVLYAERLCFCLAEALAGHLWHATREPGGSWSRSIVDAEGYADGSAISIDPTRMPRVLYNVLWSQATDAFTTVSHNDLRFAEPAIAVPSRLVPYIG